MIEEGRRVDLVGEVLDQQLRDFIGRPMGNVDGLVLELREGEPPRVSHVEAGGVTLARRLHNPLGGYSEPDEYRLPWNTPEIPYDWSLKNG